MRKQVTTFPFGLRKASEACAIAHCHLGKPMSRSPEGNCGSTFFTQHMSHRTRHPDLEQQLQDFREVPFCVLLRRLSTSLCPCACL